MKPNPSNYRQDRLFARVARAVDEILQKERVVAPVEVLLALGLLTRERLNAWRLGRVPYLERVIDCNLSRLGRILRILRLYAHDQNLKPSSTVYQRWGSGPAVRLRFTKTHEANVEEAYARHFVKPGKAPLGMREDGNVL